MRLVELPLSLLQEVALVLIEARHHLVTVLLLAGWGLMRARIKMGLMGARIKMGLMRARTRMGLGRKERAAGMSYHEPSDSEPLLLLLHQPLLLPRDVPGPSRL